MDNNLKVIFEDFQLLNDIELLKTELENVWIKIGIANAGNKSEVI